MSSTKQVAANRRNGARSTGPRTKPGKARSRRNALKHGLSAEQVVMLGEDPVAFEALRDDLYAHYQPADPVAINLVEQVAAESRLDPSCRSFPERSGEQRLAEGDLVSRGRSCTNAA